MKEQSKIHWLPVEMEKTTDLPVSLQALGSINIFGERSVPEVAGLPDGSAFFLDGAALYQKVNTPRYAGWARVPGYSWFVGSGLPGELNGIFQTNASRELPLNTLVQGETYLPPGSPTHPIPDLTESQKKLLREIESRIAAGDKQQALKDLELFLQECPQCPRAMFDSAAAFFCSGELKLAKQALEQAMLLGHPHAADAHLQITNLVAKPFRQKHHEIFARIAQKDYAAAIQGLERILDLHPVMAGSALAYCLRHTHRHKFGAEICLRALEHDPYQIDLYGHLWSFHTALGADQDALTVAEARITLFPADPQGYTDALDSALLLGDLNRARWSMFGYIVNAVNLNTALKNIFKYAECSGAWDFAEAAFAEIVPIMRSQAPETLMLFGEVLTEQGKYEQARPPLERALMASPENPAIVLAYGRSLARSGDEGGAIAFLATVLHDESRKDHFSDRMLFTTLLSELLRNTGNLPEALALWESVPQIDQTLLRKVGARPIIEYAYCQLEVGEYEEAARLAAFLEREADDRHLLPELREKLALLQPQYKHK